MDDEQRIPRVISVIVIEGWGGVIVKWSWLCKIDLCRYKRRSAVSSYIVIASQITGNSTVLSKECSGQQQRKHQRSTSLAYCEGNPLVTGRFYWQRASNVMHRRQPLGMIRKIHFLKHAHIFFLWGCTMSLRSPQCPQCNLMDWTNVVPQTCCVHKIARAENRAGCAHEWAPFWDEIEPSVMISWDSMLCSLQVNVFHVSIPHYLYTQTQTQTKFIQQNS